MLDLVLLFRLLVGDDFRPLSDKDPGEGALFRRGRLEVFPMVLSLSESSDSVSDPDPEFP